jgi:exosortase
MGISRRWLLFSGWIVFSSLLFVRPLIRLVHLSLSNSDASHLILIPFLAACVLYIERRSIFRTLSSHVGLSSLLLFLGFGLSVGTQLAVNSLTSDLELTCYILALLLLWIAGFAFSFGRAAVRAAYFPLLFLLLTVPPPNFLLDRIIYLLQAGSSDITGALFDLFGVPALREGFVFHLAQVNIEVAKECSGIRSSIVLLVLALLVAHFCLKSFWSKGVFIICGLFMMLLKNGIRIASLTLLAMYVNPGFLTGRLHHYGGIVFFLLGLLLLLPVLWILQRGESRSLSRQPSQTS